MYIQGKLNFQRSIKEGATMSTYSFQHSHLSFTTTYSRPVGRGVRGGSLEPPFWPPKDFIYTAIVHFKCPTGPLVSLLLRITAVQARLVAAMRVCS